MVERISNWWGVSSWWDKICMLYAIVVILTIIAYIINQFRSNPKKKIAFIQNAQKENCITVGKMTCLTLEGTNKYSTYHAEYMYVVDNKRYFVTYEMSSKIPMDSRKEEMNADMLLLNFKPTLMLFYDKKNPKKVLSKLEVFTSKEGMGQIKTPKKNVWRDTEKDWADYIDLRQIV